MENSLLLYNLNSYLDLEMLKRKEKRKETFISCSVDNYSMIVPNFLYIALKCKLKKKLAFRTFSRNGDGGRKHFGLS